jgi:hypothetical protein
MKSPGAVPAESLDATLRRERATRFTETCGQSGSVLSEFFSVAAPAKVPSSKNHQP